MNIVEKKRTTIEIPILARNLAESYTKVLKAPPFSGAIAMSLSQLTVEHGRQNDYGGAWFMWSIWNYNLGNITCKKDSPNPKFPLTTRERMVRKGDRLPDGTIAPEDVWKDKVVLYYRSFESFEESARFYWEKFRDKFPKSLEAMHSGDPQHFAEVMSKERYYTDLVEKYARNVKYFYPRYMSLLMTGREVVK